MRHPQTIRLITLILLLVSPSTSRAHRLDEYLQATLVTIEPTEVRLQINLTPGVDVAEHVLALIDRDHNDAISNKEAAGYCEMLKRDLIVRLDRRTLALRLTSSNFPAPDDLRTGWGIIQIEFSGTLDLLGAGSHTLTIKNRHLGRLSVYLLNAAQPGSGLIHVTKQKRNKTQSMGEIEFTFAQTQKSNSFPIRKQPAGPAGL